MMALQRILALACVTALTAACDGASPTVVNVHGVAVDLTITVHDDGMGMPGAASAPVILEVGESVSLAAVATNALGLAVGNVTVAWSTSNAAVADVSADGVVTAIGEGTAEVQATANDLSATLPVTVEAPSP